MQKIKRGSGFAGVLSYAMEQIEGIPRGRVVGGNLSALDEQSLAKEFGISRRLRPDVEKPVWHNSLRLPKGEKLTDGQWEKIGDDYMERMGFSDTHQRVYIMHDDEDGQHIHIIASRIGLNGTLYLGKNENLKSTKIIQRLEKVYDLMITKGPEYQDGKILMPDQKRPTDGELGQWERTGDQPPRYKLIELIDKALEDKPTAVQFVERLQAAGVTVKANMGKEKLNGFSFEIEGVPFKGSQLGNQYKGQSLFERGMTYEQSRDHEALKRLTRAAANDSVDSAVASGADQFGRSEDHVVDYATESDCGAATGADQAVIEPSSGALRDRDSEVDSAAKAGVRDDDAGFDDQADAAARRAASGADRERDHADLPVHNDNDTGRRNSHGTDESAIEASGGIESADNDSAIELAGYDAASSRSGSAHEMAGDLPGNDHSNEHGGLGLVDSALDLKAFDEVVSARTESSLSFARELFDKLKARAAEAMEKASSYYRDMLLDLNAYRLPVKGNRNEKAVRNMLNGLGSGEFEVRIVDGSKKLKAQSRDYSAEQLADPKTLGFLRSKNAQGLDIYVRPKHPEKSGLALVDDLNRAQLYELEIAGLKPAVVVQTSDQNFQAWIRINGHGFGRHEHAGITRIINEQIGGDPASTDQEHFGRLVGFTNRKPKHLGENGLPPFVRLESHDGRQAINGPLLLDEVRKDLEEKIRLERAAKIDADTKRLVASQVTLEVGELLNGRLERGWLKRKWARVERGMIDPDASRIDFRVAMQMRHLDIPIDEAIRVFERELPAGERKADLNDYAIRTVAKAYVTVDLAAENKTTEDLLIEAMRRYPYVFNKPVPARKTETLAKERPNKTDHGYEPNR